MRNRKQIGMLLATGATLMVLAAAPARTYGDEKEEQEVKVKLTDVPAAARTTLEKEASGATLPDQVDKETEDGKTVYEVDVKIGGKNYEIKVAEDGTLIAKKLDEEGEKEGGKDKGEQKDKD